MPRNRLLLLCTLLILCFITAALLHAQALPEAFTPVLNDISVRERRTVTQAQLLDYSYRDVLDDFQKACGSSTGVQIHYTIVSVLTDQFMRYTYHVKADANTATLCSVEPVPMTATPTVDLTRFTATPTIAPTATETPRFGAKRCEGFLYSRLRVGEQARVLLGGTPNRLHEQPDLTSTQLRLIPPGETFDVLEGPKCDLGELAWWRVRYLNTEGWIVEGQGENYFVEPIIRSVIYVPSSTPTAYPTSTPFPTSCPASPPFRLSVYTNRSFTKGQVLPGAPNNLRDQPNTGATIIGIMPPGASFTVNWGPECDSAGRTWWQVNYQGKLGWTVEGEGDSYYVEPVS